MSLKEIEPMILAASEEPPATACAVTARDLMSRPVQTIDATATMAQAWSVLVEGGHRHLIVSSNGRCVGLVDDRTLFAHWPTAPFGLESTPVRSLLRPRTSCVLPAASAATVASVMVSQDVDAVPVVDEDGHVVGVITGSDVAAAVAVHGLRRRPNGPTSADS